MLKLVKNLQSHLALTNGTTGTGGKYIFYQHSVPIFVPNGYLDY